MPDETTTGFLLIFGVAILIIAAVFSSIAGIETYTTQRVPVVEVQYTTDLTTRSIITFPTLVGTSSTTSNHIGKSMPVIGTYYLLNRNDFTMNVTIDWWLDMPTQQESYVQAYSSLGWRFQLSSYNLTEVTLSFSVDNGLPSNYTDLLANRNVWINIYGEA